MVPMDLMSLQPEVNLDHVKEAGLDPAKFPEDGKTLLDWAEAMTKRDGDKVVRSGIMMTGSGVQPTVTWGIVAGQMGFQRASADLKTAAVNPEAGIAAMGWVLDLFDKLQGQHARRHRPLQGVRHRRGLDLLDRPLDAERLRPAEAQLRHLPVPTIGNERLTYFEQGGLELYTQSDAGRHAATMDAVKWLSDNSFLWTTVGRGASPRKSILERPDYKTAGLPWEVRGAFIEGMSFATLGEIPVLAGPDFTIYSGGNFLAKTLEGVWAGQSKPEEAMEKIAAQWQKGLDAG